MPCIEFDHLSGEVWRIAPVGVMPVYLVRTYHDDDSRSPMALVCSRTGRHRRWAQRPMSVHLGDLFETKELARTEYRRRKARRIETAKALGIIPGMNLSTGA